LAENIAANLRDILREKMAQNHPAGNKVGPDAAYLKMTVC